MSIKKSIKKLAQSLDMDESEVSKAARQILNLPSGFARDPHYMLTAHECAKIESYLVGTAAASHKPTVIHTSATSRMTSTIKPVTAEKTPNEQEPEIPLPPDLLASKEDFSFGSLNHGLWVHPNVLDALQDHASLRKRLGLVLQHLGAHGRTSVVKGCADEKNQGWLRSPLGGTNGMQFYLWWTPQGSRQAKQLALDEGHILVRSVRHHDDHTALDAGQLVDYLAFHQPEIDDEELVGIPWTEEQLQFIEANDPVRLILGRPGSGKTTVLWKSIDARCGQRVLYLTWSKDLSRHAREHFDAFAPADVHVDARDFLTFLGEICGEDVKYMPLVESQALFQKRIENLHPTLIGPWAGYEQALFAEIRAHFIGRALLDNGDANSSYLELRGNKMGIGRVAAESLLKIITAIPSDALNEVFPELIATGKAIGYLRQDLVPEEFLDFDRIVADEIQDLTLLETTVLTEFCRAIARRRGHAPWFLAAGDDGQTVRPSGFDWGRTNDLIARRVGTPRKFQLEDNLRCPAKIAGVIERASERYSHLEKKLRPTKQGHRSEGQHVDAHLIHVDVQHVADAIDLLERLEDIDGVVVLSPHNECPVWLPSHLKDSVLTPADAKGLEYQSVVLLDPGKLLSRLDAAHADTRSNEFKEQTRRTMIDQLRVALSRATETLAFIDVESSEKERELSLELLGSAAPFDAEDLAEHFNGAAAPAEERVLALTRDAMALMVERPRRAWRRACQAMRLLGDASLPNGVATASIREEVYRTVLTSAAHILVSRKGWAPSSQDTIMAEEAFQVSRSELVKGATEALVALETPEESKAFQLFDQWCSVPSSPPFKMLEAVLALRDKGIWLRSALTNVAQALRQQVIEGASDVIQAEEFMGDVAGWLTLTGRTGDLEIESRQLRCKAFDSLLSAKKFIAADVVLSRVTPMDFTRTGTLREAQRRYEEAAKAFEKAGNAVDAIRCWRTIAEWQQALTLASKREETDQAEVSDLQWLLELQDLIGRIPHHLFGRLTVSEQERVNGLYANMTGKRTLDKGARKSG